MEPNGYWQRLMTRRVSRRRALAVGATASAALGLTWVACNGSTNDGRATGAGQSDQGTPQQGGVLRFGMDRDPVSFDPHIEASYRTLWTVGYCYNKLLRLSSDLKVIPDLAVEYEQPDDTTVTFKLRPGVKFHNVAPVNGRALTAEDVAYSIGRIRTPSPEFQRAYMFEAVSSIQASSPDTVTFRLSKPFAPLLNYLANPFSVIVPKEAVEAFGDLRRNAVGTGPFLLQEANQGSSYRVVRNQDYFDTPKPYLDEISVAIMPDRGSRVSAFRAGQLDIEPMSVDDVQQFRGDSGVVVQEAPVGTWYTVRYNTTRAPFNDRRVRKAIDLVLNRDEIIALAAGGAGTPTGPVNPSLSDWAIPEEELRNLPGYRKDKEQDIAEAKRLLEQAGVRDFRPELIFYTPADVHEQIAVVMKDQLARAGIQVNLQKLDYAAWTPRLLQKDYQFTVTGNGYRDNPDEYLYALFYTGASRNDTGYSNPELDKLLEQQRTTTEESARREIIVEIQRRLLDSEVPNSWLYAETLYEVLQKKLRGYTITYAHNRAHQFTDVWLEQ